MSDNSEQQLQALIEREREILRKMNLANRAGASSTVIQQLTFLLDECRFEQQDLRIRLRSDNKDSDFDNFLSIG
jgi:hypothetical protein